MTQVADGLPELVRRLGDSGVCLSATELADALWLAPWVSRPKLSPPGDSEPEEITDGESERPAKAGGRVQTPRKSSQGEAAPRPADSVAGRAGRDRDTLLHAFTDEVDETQARKPQGLPIRVPAANALPAHLPLQRALRVLRSYRPPVRAEPRELDEQATADRAAETGLVTPVLISGRRRSARLQLLMDASSSMAPWEEMYAELEQVCAGSGAFCDVKAYRVYEDKETGRPAIGPARLSTGLLRDPTGNRITLLLSDCAGPMWRSGRMQNELHRWAQSAPVAVIQPLPQRMWRRTHLRPQQGGLRRREGLGGRLEFKPLDWREADSGTLPVPVLPATEAAFGGWARLVSGHSGVALNAAVGLVSMGPMKSAAPRRDRDLDAEALIRAFRRSASPDAVLLARYLAAAPLALPVMQLVQRAMLPRTTPSHLAEVLLSGLLMRHPELEGVEGGPWYEFRRNVRGRLLETLSIGDAKAVTKNCSQYVERHFGRRVRNFPAIAAAYISGMVDVAEPGSATSVRDAPQPRGLQPFARVSGEVLRRHLSKKPSRARSRASSDSWHEKLEQARRYQERFERLGAVRDLDAAISTYRSLLEEASGDMQHCTVLGMLAGALLRRWIAARRREDLVEAYHGAMRSADRLAGEEGLERQAARTRGLLGDILREFASEAQTAAEDWHELVAVVDGLPSEPTDRLSAAYELMRRADRAWEAASRDAEPESETQRRLRQARANLDMADLVAGMAAPASVSADVPDLETADVSDAYVRHLWAAVRVLLPVGGRDHRLLELRAEAHVLLSRFYAGAGPVSVPLTGRDRAREHARIAVEELNRAAVFREEQGLVPPEGLARHWQLMLMARRGSVEWRDGASALPWLLEAAERAEHFAAETGDQERQVQILRLRAEVLREYAAATQDAASYIDAAAAVRQALRLGAGSRDEDGELLALEGETLLRYAELTEDGEAERRAIRLLRRAVGEAAPSAMRAAWLNGLGRALTARYARLGRPADRTEARTVLAEVARAPEATRLIVSQARSLSAKLLLMQKAGGEPTAREMSRAAALHQQAAEAAEEAGLLELASRQLNARASLLEQSLGPAAGAAAQRKILLFWERHGQPNSPQAREAAVKLDRLTGASDE